MTRLEVFIDAAFAFAVTMPVISFDNIPRSYDEVILAIKSIPAFILAVAQLVWIWRFKTASWTGLIVFWHPRKISNLTYSLNFRLSEIVLIQLDQTIHLKTPI